MTDIRTLQHSPAVHAVELRPDAVGWRVVALSADNTELADAFVTGGDRFAAAIAGSLFHLTPFTMIDGAHRATVVR